MVPLCDISGARAPPILSSSGSGVAASLRLEIGICSVASDGDQVEEDMLEVSKSTQLPSPSFTGCGPLPCTPRDSGRRMGCCKVVLLMVCAMYEMQEEASVTLARGWVFRQCCLGR